MIYPPGALLPTADEKAALDAAHSPSASNAIATLADIGGGGSVSVTAPITGDGTSGHPLAMAASTSASDGYATASQVTQLAANTSAIAALQAAVPPAVNIAASDTYKTIGAATVDIPLFDASALANGQMCHVIGTIMWYWPGGEFGAVRFDGWWKKESNAVHSIGVIQLSTISYTIGDLANVVPTVLTTSIGVRCLGVGGYALHYGVAASLQVISFS